MTGVKPTVVELVSSPPEALVDLATHHHLSSVRRLIVSVRPRTAVHDMLEGHGLATRSLDVQRRAGMPLAIGRLARLLRQERVDVVQTHEFDPSLIGLSAAAIARTPVRIVTRHHSDFTTLTGKRLHRWIDRRQALWADRVVAASWAVQRAMIQYEAVPENRISVIQYGYDFERLRPRLRDEDRRQAREEMGGDERIILVTVARLQWEKGHRYLLDAAPAILQAHPDVRFAFVGTGPLRDSMEADVRSRGLEDRVTFLGWRHDAPRLIEAADAVVHPTLHEAFCSVIIESLALERPLVATDVAAAPEQVDDGQTGMLVPARDAPALSAAVVDLLADRERARQFGVMGRKRVVERFGIERQLEKLDAVYEELLERTRASAR